MRPAVTLKGEPGATVVLDGSPEVPTFDQLKVGDIVVAACRSTNIRAADSRPGTARRTQADAVALECWFTC